MQARILDAAEALFAEQGYDATKVADICEEADIAYGTFFNHFPAKKDVLRRLADRAVANITEGVEELAKRPGSIEDQLITLFEGAAQSFGELGPERRDLVGRIQTIAYAESAAESDRRFHAAFEQLLAEGVAQGRVRGDVPVETMADIIASTFASLSQSACHFEDFPLRERSAAAARFLASSLGPRR